MINPFLYIDVLLVLSFCNCITEEYRRKRSTRFTYTKLWTHETWEAYNSRWRYVRSMVSFPKSRLLRMISPQLFGLMAWAAIVSYGAPAAVTKYPLFNRFSVLKLPLTPLSLISGFVAGLLTLRTNNALTRLFTGRQTWGRIMSLNRDLAQQIATYVYPYDEQLGLLCARHLAIFGMLTKTRFRDEKDNDITDAALSPVDAAYVQSQRKKAPACIQRIRQIIASMAGKVRSSNTFFFFFNRKNQYGRCFSYLKYNLPCSFSPTSGYRWSNSSTVNGTRLK